MSSSPSCHGASTEKQSAAKATTTRPNAIQPGRSSTRSADIPRLTTVSPRRTRTQSRMPGTADYEDASWAKSAKGAVVRVGYVGMGPAAEVEAAGSNAVAQAGACARASARARSPSPGQDRRRSAAAEMGRDVMVGIPVREQIGAGAVVGRVAHDTTAGSGAHHVDPVVEARLRERACRRMFCPMGDRQMLPVHTQHR